MRGRLAKRSTWTYLAILFSVGVLAYNFAVFRNVLFLLVPVAAVVASLGFALRFSNRQRELLLGFHTRQALSDYISQNPDNWLSGWAWLEYAAARRTVRGDYYGRPPSELQADWYYLMRELSPRTRTSQRRMITAFCILACLCLGGAWLLWQQHDFAKAALFPAALALLFVFQYFRYVGFSDDPMTILARRVEATRSLPGQERWETLLAIAKDDPNVISA